MGSDDREEQLEWGHCNECSVHTEQIWRLLRQHGTLRILHSDEAYKFHSARSMVEWRICFGGGYRDREFPIKYPVTVVRLVGNGHNRGSLTSSSSAISAKWKQQQGSRYV